MRNAAAVIDHRDFNEIPHRVQLHIHALAARRIPKRVRHQILQHPHQHIGIHTHAKRSRVRCKIHALSGGFGVNFAPAADSAHLRYNVDVLHTLRRSSRLILIQHIRYHVPKLLRAAEHHLQIFRRMGILLQFQLQKLGTAENQLNRYFQIVYKLHRPHIHTNTPFLTIFMQKRSNICPTMLIIRQCF